MNIQPITDYNISMNGAPKGSKGGAKRVWQKIEQKILDILPSKTINEGGTSLKNWNRIDTFLSRPAENRLLIGLTAITTQPAIDYYNHRVDDETRTVSRNRTIAKIAAGTLVGIAVRGSVYNLVKKMTVPTGKGKFSKFLMPSNNFLYNYVIKNKDNLNKYRGAVSTFASLLVMSITNFALDAPLTVYFTNKLNAKSNLPEKNKTKNVKEGLYA